MSSPFLMGPFLSSSPVAYWVPTNQGSLSFSVLSFCLFILFMRFSRQEYWSGLPFPSPVGHILSELSTTICPSWVALHGVPHCFIELDKAVVHMISLVSFLWLWFSLAYGSSLMGETDCGGNFIFWVSISLQMVTAAMILRHLLLGRKLWQT